MATHYIDPVSGNNATAVPDDENFPYLNWVAALAVGGGTHDNVFLQKSGTTAFEDLGLVTKRLTFGKYGTGANPIIDGGSTRVQAFEVSSATASDGPLTISDFDINNTVGGGGDSGIASNATNAMAIIATNVNVNMGAGSGASGISPRGAGYIIDNCTVDGAGNNGIGGSGNVAQVGGLIENCTVTNTSGNDGITLHGNGSNNIIRYNTVEDVTGEDGIDVTDQHSDCKIYGNTVKRTQLYGIYDWSYRGEDYNNFVEGCENTGLIKMSKEHSFSYCNLVKNNGGSDGRVNYRIGNGAGNGQNVTSANNTFIGTANISNSLFYTDDDGKNAKVYNNLSVTDLAGITCFRDKTGSNATYDYNMSVTSFATPYRNSAGLRTLAQWQSDGNDANGVVVTDAKFVDEANDDYNLLEDSPAVGGGFKWWGNRPRPISMSGEPLPDVSLAIDFGSHQSSWNAGHPINLKTAWTVFTI